MKVYVCKQWSKYYGSNEGSWDIVKVVASEEAAELWMKHDSNKDYEEFELEIND